MLVERSEPRRNKTTQKKLHDITIRNSIALVDKRRKKACKRSKQYPVNPVRALSGVVSVI